MTSNMNTDPKILRKLRALLARADETRNDNEHERAIAMRQAEKLMTLHAVNISTLDDADADAAAGTRGKDGLDTGSSKWRSRVIHALSTLNGCHCYRTLGRDGKTYVIGREADRRTVLELARYVLESINREASAKARGLGRGWGASFRHGASSGTWVQVREIMAERKRASEQATPGSHSTALVVVNHYALETQANEKWLLQHIGKLRTGTSSNVSNGGAYRDGQRFGKSISLNRQISGSGQRALA